MGSPTSVRIRLRIHSLVETGTEVSVIYKRVYSVLQPKPEIVKKEVSLQTVNGTPL